MPVVDNLEPTLWAPYTDEYITDNAARHLLHNDERGALGYIYDNMRMARSDEPAKTLFAELESDEIENAIEWQVRKEYADLPPPR